MIRKWIVLEGKEDWNYLWDTSHVENGEYVIRLRAFDGEDYSNETTWKVRVDNAKKEDDHPFLSAPLIVVIIVISLVFLVIAVRRPDDLRRIRRRMGGSPISQGEKRKGKAGKEASSVPTSTCPHCGGKFDMTTIDATAHFNCHFCGKEIELKK